jgi:hypothetical protein
MVNYRLFTNKEIKEIVKLYKSGISLNVVVQGTFERLPAKKALRMNARGDTI